MSEATVQATYRRYWRCQVNANVPPGYARSSDHCDPKLPHRPAWGCGYAWIAPILSDKDIEQMTAKPTSLGDAVQRSFDRR